MCTFPRKRDKTYGSAAPSVVDDYNSILAKLDSYADLTARLESDLHRLSTRTDYNEVDLIRMNRSLKTSRQCQACLDRLDDHVRILRSYQKAGVIGPSYSNVYKFISVTDKSVQTM